jgi:hypothetical protein
MIHLSGITGAKVFSATRAKEREELGEAITRWIKAHPTAEILDKIVTQSSDHEFHCLTITLFYREAATAEPASNPAVIKTGPALAG